MAERMPDDSVDELLETQRLKSDAIDRIRVCSGFALVVQNAETGAWSTSWLGGQIEVLGAVQLLQHGALHSLIPDDAEDEEDEL